MNDMGKLLILLGIILVVTGCIIYFGGRYLPLGRLPGDINYTGENGSFHFPVVTCIIISIVLSVIGNIFFR
ncbi:MAG: DUF2905 domain-containing protein [Anaerovibrio sp.]|nr:DUF2905 domain-containing protein [Anaerovibrio sp.]